MLYQFLLLVLPLCAARETSLHIIKLWGEIYAMIVLFKQFHGTCAYCSQNDFMLYCFQVNHIH